MAAYLFTQYPAVEVQQVVIRPVLLLYSRKNLNFRVYAQGIQTYTLLVRLYHALRGDKHAVCAIHRFGLSLRSASSAIFYERAGLSTLEDDPFLFSFLLPHSQIF